MSLDSVGKVFGKYVEYSTIAKFEIIGMCLGHAVKLFCSLKKYGFKVIGRWFSTHWRFNFRSFKNIQSSENLVNLSLITF